MRAGMSYLFFYHEHMSQEQQSVMQAWQATCSGDHNFAGLLAQIVIKKNERTATLKPIQLSDVAGLSNDFLHEKEMWKVNFWVPKQISGMDVDEFERVETEAKIEAIDLKDSPSVKIVISKTAVELLNELAFHWEDEIRFSFTYIQQEMEFGIETSIRVNAGEIS